MHMQLITRHNYLQLIGHMNLEALCQTLDCMLVVITDSAYDYGPCKATCLYEAAHVRPADESYDLGADHVAVAVRCMQ